MAPRVDHNEILRLHRAGWSARRIAKELGCTERTVTRVRARNGLTQRLSPFQGKPLAPERLEFARELFADGASRKEVIRTLGLNWSTVNRHFPNDRWTPAQAGELSAMIRKFGRVGVRL